MIPPDHDAWDYLLPHYNGSVMEVRRLFSERGLINLVKTRYYAGEALHHRDWLTRPLSWFDQMTAEEIADACAYVMMKRAKAQMSGAGAGGWGVSLGSGA